MIVATLSPSCPQNDAIKTALLLAEGLPELWPETRERARSLGRAFPGDDLATIAGARSALRGARLHRNNSGYRRALFWARLILNAARAREGEVRVEDPFDRRLMNRAFEAFVRKGLADAVGGGVRVKRSRFHWNPRKAARSPIELAMETDATVIGSDRCMIVDAKYYERPFAAHPRGGSGFVRPTFIRSRPTFEPCAVAIRTSYRGLPASYTRGRASPSSIEWTLAISSCAPSESILRPSRGRFSSAWRESGKARGSPSSLADPIRPARTHRRPC